MNGGLETDGLREDHKRNLSMSWVINYNSPSTDGGGCVYQPGFPECQVADKEPSNFSACSPTYL